MSMTSPRMQFKSHIAGRNAMVTVYPDRVEWQRGGRNWIIPGIVAVFTIGISLIWYRGKRGSTEMLLTRAVTSVVTRPSMTQTAVVVTVAGNTLEFRCAPAEAEQFKMQLLSQL